MQQQHTITVLVDNKPGVLSRVSGLFSRRGYNIESLAVSITENPELSRNDRFLCHVVQLCLYVW